MTGPLPALPPSPRLSQLRIDDTWSLPIWPGKPGTEESMAEPRRRTIDATPWKHQDIRRVGASQGADAIMHSELKIEQPHWEHAKNI